MRLLTNALMLGTLLWGSAAFATPIGVSIDTSTISGTPAILVFDFIDGGPPTNSVGIAGLSINGGLLGSASYTGGASEANGAYTLTDTDFFNEAALSLTAGSQISFSIAFTGFAPTSSSIPDALSVFILDSSGNSLFTTSDPSGGNALLEFDAGNASPFLYSPAIVVSASPVPEPGSFVLLSLGTGFLLATGIFRRRKTIILASLGLFICLGSPSTYAQSSAPTDVTAMVTPSTSGLVLNRTTGTFNTTVSIRNTSSSTISSPIWIAVSGLPQSVSLANGVGFTSDGYPYVPSESQTLSPGQGTGVVVLKFNNPNRVKFNAIYKVFGILQASTLPPEPGPAGLVTLQGIDSDHDGIRDDLERYIALTYPQSQKTQKALTAMIMTFQLTLLAGNNGNQNQAVTLANQTARDIECLYYVRPQDALRVEHGLLAQLTNTQLRSQAYIKANGLVGGTVFTMRKKSSWNSSCNGFNPDTLPN